MISAIFLVFQNNFLSDFEKYKRVGLFSSPLRGLTEKSDFSTILARKYIDESSGGAAIPAPPTPALKGAPKTSINTNFKNFLNG